MILDGKKPSQGIYFGQEQNNIPFIRLSRQDINIPR